MKKKIPTAEEFLCEIEDFSPAHCKIKGTVDYQVVQKLKKFAKMHVKAAIRSIDDNVGSGPSWAIEEGIKKSYPTKNIK